MKTNYSRVRARVILPVIGIIIAPYILHGATLTWLPQGTSSSQAVSNNGTIVGLNYYWTAAQGRVNTNNISLWSVSDDGKIAAGSSDTGRPITYDIKTGQVNYLSDIYKGSSFYWSYAYGLSPTGNTAVGSFTDGTTEYAAIWNGSSLMTPSNLLPGSRFQAVNGDGTIYAGTAFMDNAYSAVTWTEAGGWVNLGVLPGQTVATSRAISFDGSKVIGYSALYDENLFTTHIEPFVWTQAGGLQFLGGAHSGYGAEARSMDDKGNIIVGTSYENDLLEAVYWDSTGEHLLESLLTGNDSDIDLSTAVGISPNGRYIIGRSFGESGGSRFYLLDLGPSEPVDATAVPEPSTYGFAAAGMLLVFTIIRKIRNRRERTSPVCS